MTTQGASDSAKTNSRVAKTVAAVIALLALGALALFVYPWLIYFFG